VVTEACRKNGRKVLSWFSWQMEELRKTDEGGFTLVELLAVINAILMSCGDNDILLYGKPIHPTAWNEDSPKLIFRFTEF
jgi:hypothetical protein